MNVRLLLLLVAILALVGGGLFLFIWNNNDESDQDEVPPVVIAFGDSLVEGVGATEGHDFVSLLSQRLGIRILNRGRSGDTTAYGLRRLDADVLSEGPAVVIVLLGGNDALQGLSISATFENLEKIVREILGRGGRVLLLGIRGRGIIGDPYEKEFKALARPLDIPYVSDVMDGIFGHPQYMSDPIHPNDEGYEMIADRVEPELRKLLR